MIWLAKFALTMAVAVWLGETVFLSLVAAPVLFSSMANPQEAGAVMTLLFPPYYGVGALCALLVAGLSWWLWRRALEPSWTWLLSGGLAVAGLVCVLWAWWIVLPRAHELREATRLETPPVGAKAEFDRLHQLSVQLNGAVLVLTLATAGVLASRIR
jgi:hypothetical protein